MARKPTIADVAQRAGVSRATVSFALNDRPGIAEETKARVLAAAADLGWTPSHQARGLSLGKAGAFGLVLAREAEQIGADPFFPAFIMRRRSRHRAAWRRAHGASDHARA